MYCRTPHGVRGLKFFTSRLFATIIKSHPARGAWIEIIDFVPIKVYNLTSHPARGAWIEIFFIVSLLYYTFVAPRTGCVD